jgi:hypothetical protein
MMGVSMRESGYSYSVNIFTDPSQRPSCLRLKSNVPMKLIDDTLKDSHRISHVEYTPYS